MLSRARLRAIVDDEFLEAVLWRVFGGLCIGTLGGFIREIDCAFPPPSTSICDAALELLAMGTGDGVGGFNRPEAIDGDAVAVPAEAFAVVEVGGGGGINEKTAELLSTAPKEDPLAASGGGTGEVSADTSLSLRLVPAAPTEAAPPPPLADRAASRSARSSSLVL